MTRKNGLLRKNAKLQPADLSYNWPDRRKVCAFGAPISVNGAKGLIKNFWNAVKAGKIESVIDFRKTPAFTIGKESLLWLLSQENCEGVRFYFALKTEEDWCGQKDRPDNWQDGLTLIALGVKNDNKEIIDGSDYMINCIDKEIPDDSETVKSNPSDGGVVETIPPGPGPDVVSDAIQRLMGE